MIEMLEGIIIGALIGFFACIGGIIVGAEIGINGIRKQEHNGNSD